jgi:hypothetical protein
VEIKGDGGYVVVPPSRVWTPGAEAEVLLPYRWAHGCPCSVPPAPAWFLGWIERAPATGTAHGEGGGEGSGVPVEVEELLSTGLDRGERNTGLYRLACSLYRRMGTGPEGQQAARSVVDAVLARTDTRGFGRPERDRALRSALEFITAREQAEDASWRALMDGPGRSTP